MATLSPGQWAVDGGYWYEEADLYGSGRVDTMYRDWEFPEEEDGEGEWGDWTRGEGIYWEDSGYPYPDWLPIFDQRIQLESLETNSFMGSIEYGFCENLDVYVRLGVTSAEADLITKGVDWEDYDDPESEDPDARIYVLEEYRDKTSLDFGSGFAWQVGTRFTICRTGAWTWGGRMQFGMSDGGSDSISTSSSEVLYEHTEEYEGGTYSETVTESETEVMDADIEWWQAVAYFGPTYQLSDAFSVYIAGGWQTMQGTLDVESTETGEVVGVYVDEPDEGEATTESELHDRWQDRGEASFKLKHASAIAVFGAAWAPTEQINIGVDALIGEGGKWGIGVSGAYAF